MDLEFRPDHTRPSCCVPPPPVMFYLHGPGVEARQDLPVVFLHPSDNATYMDQELRRPGHTILSCCVPLLRCATCMDPDLRPGHTRPSRCVPLLQWATWSSGQITQDLRDLFPQPPAIFYLHGPGVETRPDKTFLLLLPHPPQYHTCMDQELRRPGHAIPSCCVPLL